MTTLLGIVLGIVVIFVITAATGWFVAQEFAYTTVDRARLRGRAKAGDATADKALDVTRRTSFMLSGAQLGITVTGLLVGYVAEPLVGEGLADLLGTSGVPAGVGLAVGTTLALLLATVVQMVFGELFPKNLAIARPESSALALATSTRLYLRLLGWLIALFDKASELLLRALRIEPVHDLEHAATARDLEAIIDESRDSGALEGELSVLLDRVLDFGDRVARQAMIPRPQVTTVDADEPVSGLIALMAEGHSRLPVLAPGRQEDDVVGVVDLRDVLVADPSRTAGDLASPPVLLPDTLQLQAVVGALRAASGELACVLDEHGGLAGVITLEDVAEELLGEITDEHDPTDVQELAQRAGEREWRVAGGLDVDEAERLLDLPLPRGSWSTLSGLVTAHLQRLPVEGDVVTVDLPPADAADDPEQELGSRTLRLTVEEVERRVPATLRLELLDPSSPSAPGPTSAPTSPTSLSDLEAATAADAEPSR